MMSQNGAKIAEKLGFRESLESHPHVEAVKWEKKPVQGGKNCWDAERRNVCRRKPTHLTLYTKSSA